MLKGWGTTFIIVGGFFALAGFASYATDIQLGIGLSGLNMIGLGIIMIGLHNFIKTTKKLK